jgi:hypothetical protein
MQQYAELHAELITANEHKDGYLERKRKIFDLLKSARQGRDEARDKLRTMTEVAETAASTIERLEHEAQEQDQKLTQLQAQIEQKDKAAQTSTLNLTIKRLGRKTRDDQVQSHKRIEHLENSLREIEDLRRKLNANEAKIKLTEKIATSSKTTVVELQRKLDEGKR